MLPIYQGDEGETEKTAEGVPHPVPFNLYDPFGGMADASDEKKVPCPGLAAPPLAAEVTFALHVHYVGCRCSTLILG